MIDFKAVLAKMRQSADQRPSAAQADRHKTGPGYGHRPFLIGFFLFSLYLAFLILEPFLHTLIISIILASMFMPVYMRIERWLGGKRELAAVLTLAIIAFALVIPVALFATAIVDQGVKSLNDLVAWVQAGNLERLTGHPWLVWLQSFIDQRLGLLGLENMDLKSELMGLGKNAGQVLLSQGSAFLGNMAGLATNFAVMFFLMFYLLRDGASMTRSLKNILPLSDAQEDRIFERIRAVSRAVMMGSFLVGVLQGVVGGIGLAIVGIPALFWGAVLGFSSLIPVVGTALVWVPATGYLLLVGQWKSAIFLVLWSALVVGSIDNFVRPLLMRGGAKLSTFYIFLGILGGIQVFGLVGLLYGPLIIALAAVMIYTYQEEFNNAQEPFDLGEGEEEQEVEAAGRSSAPEEMHATQESPTRTKTTADAEEE